MLSSQNSPIKEVVDYLRTECIEGIPTTVTFAAQCLAETGAVEDQKLAQSLLTELVGGICVYVALTGENRFVALLDEPLLAFCMLAPMVVDVPWQVKARISELQKMRSVRVRMAAWQMDLALQPRQERLGFAMAALQDKEEAVRRGAVAALEREWPSKVEIGQVLTQTVRTDRFARVRQAALEALQRAWPGREDTLDAIESQIEEESAYTYIAWLIQYLAATWRGHPRTVGIVAKLANRMKVALTQKASNKQNIRKVAVEAIGQGWNGNPKILALLKNWIKDANPHVRGTAAEVIAEGWQVDPGTLQLLKELVVKDADPSLREVAIEALRRIEQEDHEKSVL